ncbi:AAA family ATPase [Priestia megaterium]|uniref:ATP-dependent nuclease n=1 Tax=Priestia megaterium TaxID=1404 RepID=UPI002E1C487B|nr:AAA family ATPase [Priestia megaterium]
MQLTKLTVSNFRSFGPTPTIINLENMTSFIGSNSSGKTALITSLLKLFGQQPNERNLLKSDFHLPPNVTLDSQTELNLFIEAKIEFPELQEGNEKEGEKNIPPFFDQLVVREPGGIPYLRVKLFGKWIQGNTPEGEIDQQLCYVTVPEGEDETDALHAVPVYHRIFIQMIYVPAMREPVSQLRNASGTMLWRILKNIKWPDDIDKQIKEGTESIDKIFDEIEDLKNVRAILNKEWGDFHRDIRYREAAIRFNSTDLTSILKKVEVQFSPNEHMGSYTVDKLGDGLRSLFYLSLVASLIKIEKKLLIEESPVLRIVAIEEPENHISPHLLGRVMKNLKNISENSNAQVILSSHSTSIIKRIDPELIRHLRINQESHTIVKSIKLPPKKSDAFTYIKEAVKAYPELYFAKLVVLGEGDSEEIVIPKMLEEDNIEVDDSSISIVPLGGRHVNHMWRLLNQLAIPHATLLDLDLERGGGGWTRIKYVLVQLLKNGFNAPAILAPSKESMIQLDELTNLHKKDLNEESLKQLMDDWIPHLRNYNVFFSSPLDLDFSMLKSFPDAYKKTAPRGPSVPDKETEPSAYEEKVKGAVKATLKNENSVGLMYSPEDRELMIWYNSLFLGRGKPSTHIGALTNISAEDLINNCPSELQELTNSVKGILRAEILTNE